MTDRLPRPALRRHSLRRTGTPQTLSLLIAMACTSLLGAAAQQPADSAPELIGPWQGSLAVEGIELPLVFHFSESSNGTLSATLDSPAQGAEGIPVQAIVVEDDTIRLDISAIGATYYGRLDGKGHRVGQRVEGEWKQSGRVFPLTIERVESGRE